MKLFKRFYKEFYYEKKNCEFAFSACNDPLCCM